MDVGRYAVGDPVWVRLERALIPNLPPTMSAEEYDELEARHTAVMYPPDTPVRKEQMYAYEHCHRSVGNGGTLMLPGMVVCKRVSRDEEEEVYRRAGGRIQYCVHVRSQMPSLYPIPVLAGGETPREYQERMVRQWVVEGRRLTDAALEGIEVSVSPTDSVIPRKCAKHALSNLLCDECAYFHHGSEHLRTTRSGRTIVTKICVLRVLGP
jgi:hypothetical protein